MRAHLTLKNILAVIVILLIAAQLTSWCVLHKQNSDLAQQLQSSRLSSQTIFNEVDWMAQQQAMPPIPGAKRLYLPELNLTVPLNPITSSVRYNFNQGIPGDDSSNVRLTSTFMTDHAMHTKSCSDMVRLKIESKADVYSPTQPLYATVTLADGRMLQVYTSTTKECQSAWRTVSPQSIAETFKDAASY
jgi:hypothetical protein